MHLGPYYESDQITQDYLGGTSQQQVYGRRIWTERAAEVGYV
jgi:hypothetical protein